MLCSYKLEPTIFGSHFASRKVKMEEIVRNGLNMILVMLCLTNLDMVLGYSHMNVVGEQPLAKIAIHKTVLALHSSASITAAPFVLGIKVSSLPLAFSMFWLLF